jgi:hypothetical protein
MFVNTTIAKAQLEISTGYAINRVEADGVPIQIGYSFKLNSKINTKSQIGYKYLYHYNDFVEASIRFSLVELHQTISYDLIKKQSYILSPNIGINYRFYSVFAEIKPPYNTIPQRAWIIERIRGNKIRLNSFDGDGTKSDRRNLNNIGFSFQLQNQFKLKKNLWFHITPYIEPDYDGTQNVGGGYVGLIFKTL